MPDATSRKLMPSGLPKHRERDITVTAILMYFLPGTDYVLTNVSVLSTILKGYDLEATDLIGLSHVNGDAMWQCASD